jgi:hypothetical protein
VSLNTIDRFEGQRCSANESCGHVNTYQIPNDLTTGLNPGYAASQIFRRHRLVGLTFQSGVSGASANSPRHELFRADMVSRIVRDTSPVGPAVNSPGVCRVAWWPCSCDAVHQMTFNQFEVSRSSPLRLAFSEGPSICGRVRMTPIDRSPISFV